MSPTTAETIESAKELLSAHNALVSKVRQSQQSCRHQLHTLSPPPYDLLRLPFIESPSRTPPDSPSSSPASPLELQPPRLDLPPAKRARLARYSTYIPEEETIRNDYSQRYVDGGEWPQNWVLGSEPERRFEEYPKQQRLLNLKKASVDQYSFPSHYLPISELSMLKSCKFDVILLDPPFSSSFTWQALQDLPIPSLAAEPSFVFLWVGSGAGDGLERGRELLAKWGYRRCEDVVWVKTNKTTNLGPGTDPPTTSLFTRTKQHCLIGIRGTVRRSTDSWFVHCNVDTDVIIWEGDPADPTRKPPEMYTLIENFCLGTRRLEIFGKARTSFRRGWVTVLAEGQEVTGDMESIKWEKESWEASIKELAAGSGGKFVVPMTSEIEALRPKSPFRPGAASGGAGRGTVATSPGFSGNIMGPAAPPAVPVQPSVIGMGMPMAGMPVPGMEGMWPIGVGGMGVNMMGGMGMGMGIPMAQPGMGATPYGPFAPTMGLGGPWMDLQAQGGGAGWDGSGMEGLMGGNMMGMGMGHGMGMMGQWGTGAGGGFDGY